jgi:hypothetical protein
MKDRITKSRSRGRSKERMATDAPKFFETFEPGDVSHQGDLIIVAIPALPPSARPRADRQLADGTTQGSRHVLARGEVFDVPPRDAADAIFRATGCRVNSQYVGPVFVAPQKPTPHDLTHPEHGHQGFPAGTVCAVVYQRNLDAEQREARVLD